MSTDAITTTESKVYLASVQMLNRILSLGIVFFTIFLLRYSWESIKADSVSFAFFPSGPSGTLAAGIIALGVLALLVHRWEGMVRLMHGVNILLMIGLVERCWQVLAVERGWVFGDCDMEAGLPAWFALDKWFPAIFEVQTSCGYTPFILFNISMAEILMALSAALLVFSCTIFSLNWASTN